MAHKPADSSSVYFPSYLPPHETPSTEKAEDRPGVFRTAFSLAAVISTGFSLCLCLSPCSCSLLRCFLSLDSFMHVLASLARFALSSGLVTLPWAAKTSGLIGACLLFLIVPFISWLTLIWLIHMALGLSQKGSRASYPTFLAAIFGRTGFLIGCALIAVCEMGVMCSYLVMLGALVPSAGSALSSFALFHDRGACFLLLLIPIVPLCCLQDLGFLAFSSLLSDAINLV